MDLMFEVNGEPLSAVHSETNTPHLMNVSLNENAISAEIMYSYAIPARSK